MRKTEYLWKELVSEINNLPAETSKAEFYNFLCKWVIDNQVALGKYAFERSGVLLLTKLNPNDYALEYTEESVSSMIERINRLDPPNSNQTLVMFIESRLEDLIVFHVEQDCANNCTSCELGVWKNLESINTQFVYICPLCNFAQYPNGDPYNNEKIEIASKIDLKEKNVLPKPNLISTTYNAIVSSVKQINSKSE